MITGNKFDIAPLALMEYQVTDDRSLVCSVFGCGKHLTLIESLAGNVCTSHMGIQPPEPIAWTKPESPKPDNLLNKISEIKEKIKTMCEILDKLTMNFYQMRQ